MADKLRESWSASPKNLNSDSKDTPEYFGDVDHAHGTSLKDMSALSLDGHHDTKVHLSFFTS